MIKKWYIVLGGGLGDALRCYFLHEPIWGKLPAIKTKYPNSFIRLISVCHNPQVEEFFRYYPYLDEKLFFPWEPSSEDKQSEFCGDCTPINSEDFSSIQWEKPQIYLCSEDVDTVRRLGIRKPYIIIHPFAGLGDWYGMAIDRYASLCKGLVSKGYNLYVVGASYDRTNKGCIQYNKEVWDLEIEGVYSLVDELNAREVCQITKNANGFIGSHSCWAHVAWAHDVPTTVLFSSKASVSIKSGNKNFWAMEEHRKSDVVITNTDQLDTEEIAKRIVEHYGRLKEQ